MKIILICLLVLTVQLAEFARVRRQNVFGSMDLKKIPQILQNKDAVNTYVKCLLASEQEATSICDRLGKQLREAVPNAIKSAKCPDPCNDEEKKAVALVIRVVREKYADLYNKILEHYHITPEQIKNLDDWLATIPSK